MNFGIYALFFVRHFLVGSLMSKAHRLKNNVHNLGLNNLENNLEDSASFECPHRILIFSANIYSILGTKFIAHFPSPADNEILLGKVVALTQQIDERDGDGAVHVEDKVGPLRRCHLLHLQRIVEERVFGETLGDEFFDDTDARIRIFHRLNAMTDSHDVEVLLLHVLDELSRAEVAVEGSGELLGRVV
jgi:hypothetical protein